MNNTQLIDRLNQSKHLEYSEWLQLLSDWTEADRSYAQSLAQAIAIRQFDHGIYFRGIVEFTNYCKNNCYYCGIRRDNHECIRYRLTEEEILSCCASGYAAGFRTFVLQGGEDPYYSDEIMCSIISAIHLQYPDCAITLSIGEKSRNSYQLYFNAGARRYLLRHETASADHYAKMHPPLQTSASRMQCLRDLKDIGYQTGAGMMVGCPFQTPETLAEDMMFLTSFKPEMIGTGPFIPHHQTPFKGYPAGSVTLTLFLLSLCRIALPGVLLPATTALGTASSDGRQKGVLAGANVIMPNLSPVQDRAKYMLYDHKKITGDDAAESLNTLQKHLNEIGYHLVVARGDYRKEKTL
ncbi:MAG: [FeFe] hydrogenase H-cluster radical SAM maturase HydE [Erysipelotrichia bacterium]|nr:[FeFe] hydrogenase H-cluster radical SAM maturase HydE [Erysipelotrichia bacterium]